MARKEPNPIDVHVGARLKMRRMIAGLSQEKLGEHLGLTFQQVQKYEKGTNRIGASRLLEIARVLETPISYFYEGLNMTGAGEGVLRPQGFAEHSPANFVVDFLSTNEGLELNKAFRRIRDTKVRRKIVELVRALAGDDEPA